MLTKVVTTINDQVQSLFRLDQHCKSLIVSLSAFGGVVAFVEEKFRDGIRKFVKVEICCFLSNFPSHIG